jgi:spermidine/putrescine transport system ATP-binding protein
VTMSDRIAVMNAGRAEQVAAPQDVYEEPDTVFVAEFLGVSNVMDAIARGPDGDACKVSVGDFELCAERGSVHATGQTKLVIRPERVRLEPAGTTGPNRIPAMLERWVYLGSAVQLTARLVNGVALQALIQNTGDEIPFDQGSPMTVHLPSGSLRVLSHQTDLSPMVLDEHSDAAQTGRLVS